MILTSLLLAASPAPTPIAAPPVPAPASSVSSTPTSKSSLLAIRAARVEVGNGETLHDAVILVEDGKIVTLGEGLPIERGIPVLELEEDQVVIPGLVVPYSRAGMSGRGTSDSRPWIMASSELYPASEAYAEALEAGVTTLGQYPGGSGIPGQAVAVRPKGATREAMTLADGVYLKIVMASNRSAKGNISGGFEKADDWLEKEKKNREKWEKEKEKADKEKDEEKKKEKDPGPYVPLEPDPKAQAFLDLRAGTLKALISIRSAGDYLHLLDAIDDEEFQWDMRLVMTRELDVFHVAEQIGEAGLRVLMEPELSLHPGTMRQRNLPAELARAGAKLALVPRSDSSRGFRDWLRHTGELVAAGLDYQTALRAMTLEAAAVLGLEERLGSLEPGKDANLLILDGDPFEVGTEVDAVMLDGQFVHGEVNL